jgi:hypothetical protein
VAYFLALQKTKFGPTNMAKPPVDHIVYHQGSLPNLHLKKALRNVEEDLEKLILIFNVS